MEIRSPVVDKETGTSFSTSMVKVQAIHQRVVALARDLLAKNALAFVSSHSCSGLGPSYDSPALGHELDKGLGTALGYLRAPSCDDLANDLHRPAHQPIIRNAIFFLCCKLP